MTVTIKDLAQMANTSTATVSRVLSNKPGVAEEKRRSILQLADKVGYTPNRIAQNLALQKSHLIGLIAAELRSPAYVDFFRRIQTTLEKMGYRVLIADSELQVDKEKHNIAMMREQRVEGLIVFPVHDWQEDSDVEHFLALKLQKFPFVIVGRIEGYGFDFVTSEEERTAEKLARHLLELGHRRIAFVGSDPHNRCIQERRRGVEQAVRSAGAELAAWEFPIVGDAWLADLKARLAEERNRPTALVFVNDVMALMAYRAIGEAGLAVPRDLSVAAFGDNVWSRYLTPALTTTREDNREIARLALETLLQRIGQPARPAVREMVPQEMVFRESCAKVK